MFLVTFYELNKTLNFLQNQFFITGRIESCKWNMKIKLLVKLFTYFDFGLLSPLTKHILNKSQNVVEFLDSAVHCQILNIVNKFNREVKRNRVTSNY